VAKREAEGVEYLARVDVSQNPQLLGHQALIPTSDFGVRLGFGAAVMQARGLLAGNAPPQAHTAAEPLPLLTWPFLDFLSALVLTGIELIELGSGNSTLAFAAMFDRVTTYENNDAWADALAAILPANVTLRRFTGDTLDASRVDIGPEQWLLVDFAGKRTRFISELIAGRSATDLPAVVILDNSDWYRNGAALLSRAGYTEIPFYGMKSGQTWISCTSFFFMPQRTRLVSREPFFQPLFSRPVSPAWDSLT